MTKFSLTLKFTFFNLARTASPQYTSRGGFATITSSSRCVMSSVSMKGTFGVKTYLDLENRKTIFRDNKGKSGIYRFVNLRSGKTYIGSSVDLTRRFRDYFSPR